MPEVYNKWPVHQTVNLGINVLARNLYFTVTTSDSHSEGKKTKEMAPLSEPSLPDLLAIGKTHENLNDQLRRAATFAGLPEDWAEPQLEDYGGGSQHRAEFVLKRLLKMMKEGGHDECANANAWTLLRRVVRRVPLGNAAKLLKAYDVLSIVEKALETAVAAYREADEPKLNTMNSRKRKRNSSLSMSAFCLEPVPSPHVEEVKREEEERLMICGGIQRFLSYISSASENREDAVDDIAQEHIKAVLRTDTEQAARLLGLWFSLLRYAMPPHLELDNAEKKLAFHAMSAVWDSRALDASDENGWSSSAFTSAALVPGCLLYARERTSLVGFIDDAQLPGGPIDRGLYPDDVTNSDSTHQTGFLQSFERLLVRHVLVPARTAFLEAYHSPSKSAGFAIDQVMSFFEPLKVEIERTTLPTSNLVSSSRPLVRTLPRFLEVAIDILPPTSIEHKRKDERWIEAVLISLANCTGVEIPEEPQQSSASASKSSSLCSLMRVVKKKTWTLSTRLLQRILVVYSGLDVFEPGDDMTEVSRDEGEDTKIQWDVIATILQMDGSLFMRSTGALNEQDGTTTRFADLLLHGISLRRYYLARDESSRRNNRRLIEFVHGVVSPLMQAYADRRCLPGFIASWYEGLKSCDGDSDVYVWTSEHLTPALSSLLENSLTPKQIFGILEKHLRVLETMNRASMPDVIITDAVLQSISKEETIDMALPAFRALKDVLMNRLQTEVDRSRWRIWRVLARTYEFLFEAEEPATVLALKRELAAGGFLDSVCEHINAKIFGQDGHVRADFTTPSQLYAFNFTTMASSAMLDIAELRESASGWINAGFESLSSCLSNPLRAGPSRLTDFTAVLLQYPKALSVLEGATRLNVFITLIEYSTAKDIGKSRHNLLPRHNLLDVNCRDIIFAIHESVLALDSQDLRNDYISAITIVLKSRVQAAELALELLLHFPPSAIRRSDRETVLDVLNERICPNEGDRHSQSCTALAVLAAIHLLEAPCLTSDICSDPDVMHELIARFEGCEQVVLDVKPLTELKHYEFDYVPYLTALFSLVFRQVTTDGNARRRELYLDTLLTDFVEYVDDAVRVVEECTTSAYKDEQQDLQPLPGVYQALLRALFNLVRDWSKIGGNSELWQIHELAKPILDVLSTSLPTFTKLLETAPALIDNLELSYVIEVLSTITSKKDLFQQLGLGQSWRRLLYGYLFDNRAQQQRTLPIPMGIIECAWYDTPLVESVDCCRVLLGSEFDPEIQSEILSYWKTVIGREENPVEIASAIEATWLHSTTQSCTVANLQLQYALIKALTQPQQFASHSESSTERVFSSLLPKLSEVVRDAASVAEFCAAIANIQVIISEKVRDIIGKCLTSSDHQHIHRAGLYLSSALIHCSTVSQPSYSLRRSQTHLTTQAGFISSSARRLLRSSPFVERTSAAAFTFCSLSSKAS